MGKARLFGYGNLKRYGGYCIVVAEDIEEATEMIQKEIFKTFKEILFWNKDNAHFDRKGEALNGCAEMYGYCNKKGYYDMNDEALFDAFCKNEFGKDLFCIESDEKPFEVTDLNTNVWKGEWA